MAFFKVKSFERYGEVLHTCVVKIDTLKNIQSFFLRQIKKNGLMILTEMLFAIILLLGWFRSQEIMKDARNMELLKK